MRKKIIFSYWHQGFDSSPAVVKLCTNSLLKHNAGWEIHLLDKNSITNWIEPIPISNSKWEKLPLPHKSDIIRTQLLKNYGGVWADPTLYFTGPLDSWLFPAMESGVFFFDQPGRDRLISNWFIASEPGNYIVSEIYKSLCDYWSSNNFKTIGFTSRPIVKLMSRAINRNVVLPRAWFSPLLIALLKHAPYMVYHYNFAKLVHRDREFCKIWKEMPKISADGPHALLRYGLHNPPSEKYYQILESGSPNLFKLTWKHRGESPNDSILRDLFRRDGLDLIS